MVRILFVCLGNICRSPMAEFVFRDMAEKRGMAGQTAAASAATSSYEAGNPVYPPAAALLRRQGLDPAGKRSVPLTQADGAAYDHIIGMDAANLRDIRRILGPGARARVSRLLDWTARPGDVADPWYTGDFETTWNDVSAGCEALLNALFPEA